MNSMGKGLGYKDMPFWAVPLSRPKTKHKNHWSFDDTQENGEVRFKAKRGRPSKVRKQKRVTLREPKPKAIRQRKQRVIAFRVGDYVMFNPEREGHPLCVDGTVTRVHRCYDKRTQEFIQRVSISETPPRPFTWTVRYPGVAIVRRRTRCALNMIRNSAE